MEGRRGPKNSTLSPGERWLWPPHDPTTHPGGAQVIGERPAAASGLEEWPAAGPPGHSGLAWLTIFLYRHIYVGYMYVWSLITVDSG